MPFCSRANSLRSFAHWFLLLACLAVSVNCQQTHSSTILSTQASESLAATSVGSKALFGGGYIFPTTSTTGVTAAVDIYDEATHTWSFATLSQARSYLAATSVGTKALFAVCNVSCFASLVSKIFFWVRFQGGATTTNTFLPSAVVDIFEATTGMWSVAQLSQPRVNLAATSLETHGLAFFAGGSPSGGNPCVATVDVYNFFSNAWTNSSLSQGRQAIGATSIGSKAIFAVLSIETVITFNPHAFLGRNTRHSE